MTFRAVAYVVIGVVVYALTDTSRLSSRLSEKAIAPSYGNVQKYLAVLVIFLWPVWLLIKPRAP